MRADRWARVQGQIALNVARFGQHLQFVFGSDDEPEFCYTIGNRLRGMPEFLIVGNYGQETAAGALNMTAMLLHAEGKTGQGEGSIDLGGDFPARLHDCRDMELVRGKYTCQAGNFYGDERYDVVQLLLWDDRGRYGNDPACHPAIRCPLL